MKLHPDIEAKGVVTNRVNLPSEARVQPVNPAFNPFRKNKFGNNRIFVTPAGEYVGADHPGPKKKVFDSQKEFKHWTYLTGLQAYGMICFLRKQVGFPLDITGKDGKIHRLGFYRADFVYVENGVMVVVDVKGFRTDYYKLKKIMFEAIYGIKIKEV